LGGQGRPTREGDLYHSAPGRRPEEEGGGKPTPLVTPSRGGSSSATTFALKTTGRESKTNARTWPLLVSRENQRGPGPPRPRMSSDDGGRAMISRLVPDGGQEVRFFAGGMRTPWQRNRSDQIVKIAFRSYDTSRRRSRPLLRGVTSSAERCVGEASEQPSFCSLGAFHGDKLTLPRDLKSG